MSTSTTETARRRLPWVIGILLLAVVLLIATGGVLRAMSRVKDVRAGDSHVLVDGLHLHAGGRLKVAYLGTLSVVQPCLGLTGSAGEEAVVVWPRGTKVSGRGATLTLRVDGKVIRIGDQISYGRYESEPSKIPGACRGHRVLRVFDVEPMHH